MEVESLGEAEPECIEFEEQRPKFRSQQEVEGLRKEWVCGERKPGRVSAREV